MNNYLSENIIKFHTFLKQNKEYNDFMEDSKNFWWDDLQKDPTRLSSLNKIINEMYFKSYKGDLNLLLESGYSDDYICEFHGKYYLVHGWSSDEYQCQGVYDTPEEVWEKVIKPDIDRYYE